MVSMSSQARTNFLLIHCSHPAAPWTIRTYGPKAWRVSCLWMAEPTGTAQLTFGVVSRVALGGKGQPSWMALGLSSESAGMKGMDVAMFWKVSHDSHASSGSDPASESSLNADLLDLTATGR